MAFFCNFTSGSRGNSGVYLDGSLRVLIDAGTNTKYIASCLRELGLTTQDLTHVVITHAHSDHVGGIPELAATSYIDASGATHYLVDSNTTYYYKE